MVKVPLTALAAADAVIVRDRIETDIAMGKRLGLRTIRVVSGVTRADDPPIAALAPDHVIGSVYQCCQHRSHRIRSLLVRSNRGVLKAPFASHAHSAAGAPQPTSR
ncbi:MAG: hypothetical protein C5B48_16400 [Candidatus Rokuibacteriota bacterium]|nr:MAG: hypothetical protein C5B48_16400 [Candidatus Rokubacteria bacterium]